MSKRLASIGRIVSVQRALHRAAEWRLAELDRRVAELERSQADFLRFLSDDHAFSGLFTTGMANRLRSLAGEIVQAGQARRVEAETVLREAGRLKRAERMQARLAREAGRAAEAVDLLDAIERAAAPAGASHP